jgi:hypothetical protein
VAFGLELIHWQAAWLQPFAQLGEPLAQQIIKGNLPANSGLDDATKNVVSVASVLNQTLSLCPPLPVLFVAQSELPEGQAYEDFIFQTKKVPTRDGLHDFFNALVWLHLPQTKLLLNQLQAQEITKSGISAKRGALRDALTLFDENVLLLYAPDELWLALENKLWQKAMVDLRAQWQAANYLLFGHALQEKLVAPRKGMCAHVLRVPQPFQNCSELDLILKNYLTPQLLASKPYCHLPVLGIPGWCAENEDASYYQDHEVFRAKRK